MSIGNHGLALRGVRAKNMTMGKLFCLLKETRWSVGARAAWISDGEEWRAAKETRARREMHRCSPHHFTMKKKKKKRGRRTSIFKHVL